MRHGTLFRWQTILLAAVYVLCAVGSIINMTGDAWY